MDIAIVIAVISGLLQIAGYIVYNVEAQKGETKPDSASWSIWAFGSIVNVLSYAVMTRDWVKDILPFSCSMACLFTFALCLYRRQFGRLNKKGWKILIVDCVITVVWYFTSATEANLLYQIGTVISFIPMLDGIKDGTDKENWLPWAIWTCAYALFGLSVFLRLNNWAELVYPVICLILHANVTWIAFLNRST